MGAFETARRILQHAVDGDCGFTGLEWNGQALCVESAFVVSALMTQWFEIASHAQIEIATVRQHAVALTAVSIVESAEFLKCFLPVRATARPVPS